MTSVETTPVPKEGGSTMYCTECGTRNPANARFCKQCGRPMEQPEPAEEAPANADAQVANEGPAPVEMDDARLKERLLAVFRLSEDGKVAEATQACEEVLRSRPDSADAHSLMSSLYERAGDMDPAIAEREKVVAINVDSVADREKLQALRAGVAQTKPRKVTSARLRNGPVLFESRAGAAWAGAGAFVVILVVGATVVWMRGSRTPVPTAPVAPSDPYRFVQQQAASGGVLENPGVTIQRPGAQGPRAGQFPAAGSAPAGAGTAPQVQPRQQAAYPSMEPAREIPPARVATPPTAALERDPRAGGTGTYHLPDGAPETGATAPAPRAPAKESRIEIEMDDRPTRSTGTRAHASSGASDSRSRRATAMQYQVQGDYSRAAAEYEKALDGAGDDAANIHQQIALCYQRLGQKDKAVIHYGEAITAFRGLISAGRGVDSANQGIRACETGIKACR